MKAVIMAGGRGTRLAPLTSARPKPMVPVLNRPVLEHLIRLLARHGVTEAVLTTHYLTAQIEEALGSGEQWGVALRYAVETSPLGTAGSVRQVLGELSGTFLVLSGDALTDISLSAAVRWHREHAALCTLVVTEVEDPSPYGIVEAREDGRIVRFLEKPRRDQIFSRTVNTGIYVMEPGALEECPPGVPFDFSRDLFPRLLQKGAALYAFRARGYWSDIGDCGQYLRAQIDALHRRVRLSGLPRELAAGVWVEDGAFVHPLAVVQPPALIGAGCRVEAGARVGPEAVLGRGCRVRGGAVVEGAVLWEESEVGEAAVVMGATVGRGCRLGARARVMEGAVLGDWARVPDGGVVKRGERLPAAAPAPGLERSRAAQAR
ncbi:MAG: NDP-sugar synthase [Clostridia bacterium]|nr:hypothetical protein [Bacillota bacterium]